MDDGDDGSRRSTPAERLMEAAEILIGERGPSGVSLREISRMAGQRNNYAVQYHFGDYNGLLCALEASRIAEVEKRRAEMYMSASKEGGLGDLRVLTNLLYLPLINFRAPDGERRYARFVLALLNASPSPLIDSDTLNATSAAHQVLEHMCSLLPWLPMPLLMERQRLIAIMVLTSIFNRRSPFDRLSEDGALVDNALDMATFAVTAPIRAGLGVPATRKRRT